MSVRTLSTSKQYLSRLIAITLSVLCFGTFTPASAQLEITITGSRVARTPIAVVDFQWTGTTQYPPEDIAKIIRSDLGRSGLFAPLEKRSMPSQPMVEGKPNFALWRSVAMPNIVTGRIQQTATQSGRLEYRVEFSLSDALKQTATVQKWYQVRGDEIRRIAHRISDEVFLALTGERGAFDTRIAYVTETSDLSGGRYYALNVADSDGFGKFAIVESEYPVMSPAWSNDGTRLAYVSFDKGQARIWVQDLATASRREVAAFPGINGAPAWSPDDSRIALTLSKDGNPEIYVLHLRSGVLRRLTNSAGIDTEPNWAPDGQQIVFTSDRGGSPQIYRVSASGGRAQRVSFQGKYNARPTFSPDGSRLAMVHGDQGIYRIGMLEFAPGSVIQVLTDGTLDESPTFAPNGKMILYATVDRGGATLAAVSADGEVKQRLGVDRGGIRDPAWSPYMR
jgi:TolB protein